MSVRQPRGFEDSPNFVTNSIDRRLHEDISRLFAENFSNAVVDADSPQMKLIEETCRENLETSVTDPELRERLRPDYRAACKRLVISPDFYQAIQKPNAELVDEAIERVEAKGIRTRVLSTTFLKFTKMPCAVSGRKYTLLDAS